MDEELLLFRTLKSEKPETARYFRFEEDFIEKNMRCIPMIVRFKMDAAGIKLKLAEWSRMTVRERMALAEMPCSGATETERYREFLVMLVKKHTGQSPAGLAIDPVPAWADLSAVPAALQQQCHELGATMGREQWQGLSDLQRFTLLKLCRPGHENKNFPKAMKEFHII